MGYRVSGHGSGYRIPRVVLYLHYSRRLYRYASRDGITRMYRGIGEESVGFSCHPASDRTRMERIQHAPVLRLARKGLSH